MEVKKMKNAIRIISLLLVLVMCIGVFAACGGSSEKTDDDKTENSGDKNQSGDKEGDTDADADTDTDTDTDSDVEVEEGGVTVIVQGNVSDKIGKQDFGGKQIKFVVTGASWDKEEGSLQTRSIDLRPLDDDTYEVNSAILDRNAQVEKELNVDIVLEYTVSMQALSDHLTPLLATKIHTYDVVAGYQYFDIGMTLGDNIGTFLNYENIDPAKNFIDMSAPYWDSTMYETMKYKDCAFWITGDLSLSWVSGVTVSFVNQTMWDQYIDIIKQYTGGITDLYELVEKKMWTIDLVSEISKNIWQDTNNNEVVDYGDVVGFISYKDTLNCIMTDVLAAGAGISYSTLDADGVPTMSFYNNRTNLFANRLNKLYTQSNALLVDWDDDKYVVEMFGEGNVLFTPNYLHQAESSLREMTDTYLVLPPPLLLKGENYTTCLGDNVSQYGIPTTTAKDGDLAATTATLEAMAFYSNQMVSPVYYDKMLKGRFTALESGDKQAGMIDLIRKSTFSDFAMVWSNQLGNVTWFFRSNCLNNRLTQQVKAQETSWRNKLTTLLEDIESSLWVED